MASDAEPTSGAPPGTEEPPPPLLGTWGRMYLLVLGGLVLTVLVFALLSEVYG